MLRTMCPLWITGKPKNLENLENPGNPALARFFGLSSFSGFSVKSWFSGFPRGGRT